MFYLRPRYTWHHCLLKWDILFLVIAMQLVAAVQVNRTIDDHSQATDGSSVTYSGNWNYGPDCIDCFLRVVPLNQTRNNSWHDVQVNSTDTKSLRETNLTLTFLGTGIYVYGINPNTKVQAPNNPTVTNLTFTLDGSLSNATFFANTSEGFSPKDSVSVDVNSNNFQFNTLVYHETGLKNETHNLVISLGSVTDPRFLSGFLFDYANYTYDGPITSPPSPSNTTTGDSICPMVSRRPLTAAIASSAVGWALFMATALVFVFYWRRHNWPVRVSIMSDKIASSDKGADLDHELAASPELPHNNGANYRTSKRYRQEKSPGGLGMSATAQEQSIREQMAALQAEMERLRAQNAEVIAEVTRGPPAY